MLAADPPAAQVERPWIETFLEAPPPAVLYHYTDQNGLHGIVTHGEFWATNFRFFNDSSEFDHAKAIAGQEIERLLGSEKRERAKAALAEMKDAVDAAGINVYVSSWSAASDDLSQWRAYSGSRTGYQIGVSGTELARIAEVNEFVLVRCLYSEDEKRRKMSQLIERCLTELMEANDPIDEHLAGGSLPYYLNRCACMFKHEAFRAEMEWRLISQPSPLSAENADVRTSGRSTMVPFYRVKARRGEPPALHVESIRVGPCPHREEAMQAVRALLFRHNAKVGPKTVSASSIPYRNW